MSPPPQQSEIEFKLVLQCESEFLQVAEQSTGRKWELPPPLLQTNYFFDAASGSLRDARIALRLRKEANRYQLTLKGKSEQSSAEGALTMRREEEFELSAEQAQNILSGDASPLTVFELNCPNSQLLELARTALGTEPVQELGSFENQRRRLGPLELSEAEGIELCMEFDRSVFPDGAVEYELEVEVPDFACDSVERALRRAFEAKGIPWRTASSKAQRFFERLDP